MLRIATGGKYKLLWKGCAEGLNGVGVIIAEEFIDKVVKVVRVYDRLMMVKVLVGQCLVNIISAYAPHVGRSRSQDEKDDFWEALWKLIEGVKQSEKIILGGDLNGHVGKNSEGYEGLHGGHGYGVRNMEGETILEFYEAAGMIVCGIQFSKTESKLISYSSGGYNTTVDYLLAQKQDTKYLKDAKAFPGPSKILSVTFWYKSFKSVALKLTLVPE